MTTIFFFFHKFAVYWCILCCFKVCKCHTSPFIYHQLWYRLAGKEMDSLLSPLWLQVIGRLYHCRWWNVMVLSTGNWNFIGWDVWNWKWVHSISVRTRQLDPFLATLAATWPISGNTSSEICLILGICSENAGLLGLTWVGSHRVLQISAGFMIFFSVLGDNQLKLGYCSHFGVYSLV